jgi:hypothetical protein
MFNFVYREMHVPINLKGRAIIASWIGRLDKEMKELVDVATIG